MAVDFNDLEFVAMQMHGMAHRGWIAEDHLDPLPVLHPIEVSVGIEAIIQPSAIGGGRVP